MEQFRKDSFVGTGPEVAARIRDLKERVGVDEMAVVTWTHDEEVRRESYTAARARLRPQGSSWRALALPRFRPAFREGQRRRC